MVEISPNQKNTANNTNVKKNKSRSACLWIPMEDLMLKNLIKDHLPLEIIAEKIKRKLSSIRHRAYKLELFDHPELTLINVPKVRWPDWLRFENITKTEARAIYTTAPICAKMPTNALIQGGVGVWWWVR